MWNVNVVKLIHSFDTIITSVSEMLIHKSFAYKFILKLILFYLALFQIQSLQICYCRPEISCHSKNKLKTANI